jgi:6-phosphogluconolactonase
MSKVSTPSSFSSSFAYIGSRTTTDRNARGTGITVYQYQATTGEMTLIQTVSDLVNPSYLVINRAKTRLYAVHGDQSEVSSFAIDADGKLTFLNQVSCEGKNPVHLALSKDERFLIVSNHLSSTVVTISITPQGRLDKVCSSVTLEGKVGPHLSEQPFAKPHYNGLDSAGRFVVVPDKGVDQVFVLRLDDGQLLLHSSCKSREGAGPRHMVFHPTQPFAYVVNELNATLTGYHWDNASGTLTPFQTLPTQMDSVVGDSRSAALQINRQGSTLYVSNRGHAGCETDSISVFQVQGDGRVRLIQSAETLGKTPRFITLSLDERFLFALNEDSDSVVRFEVDGVSGELSHPISTLQTGSPVCLIFS